MRELADTVYARRWRILWRRGQVTLTPTEEGDYRAKEMGKLLTTRTRGCSRARPLTVTL